MGRPKQSQLDVLRPTEGDVSGIDNHDLVTACAGWPRRTPPHGSPLLPRVLGEPLRQAREAVLEVLMVVLMRAETDCEEAACATATGRTWEELHKALGKKGMPNSIEDPVASSPVNVKRAVESLGFRCDEVGLDAILHGRATPGKTVVLVHNPESPLMGQHWCVWQGIRSDGFHLFSWGGKLEYRAYSGARVAQFVTAGKLPQCVFTVVPVARPLPWYRRILYWLGLRRG